MGWFGDVAEGKDGMGWDGRYRGCGKGEREREREV